MENKTAPADSTHLLSDKIVRTPLYFRTERDPLFGWYHAPKERDSETTGMVICSPIGYEYISGHRAIRHLADRFAHDGIPTIRFDYQGTGDSAGTDEEPDRLSAWLESTRAAIRTLKEVSGCTRVGLIGVRIGSIMASLIAEESDLACLILWAPCVMGRHYIREMQLLEQRDESDSTDRDRGIESAGFVLTDQTVKDLLKIKLTTLTPQKTNILIVARDDLKDNFKLREHWQSQGLDVDYTRMSGYIDFLSAPHKTVIPVSTIRNISRWIKENSTHSHSACCTLATRSTETTYTDNITLKSPAAIRERIIRFGENNALFGIISEPINSNLSDIRPTIILLNSGAVHHVGTNRFYVMLARHLAQNNFTTLRMDIAGLGDSFIDEIEQENALYGLGISNNVDSAMTHLKEGEGKKSFVVAGLCFGSYASFHTALKSSHCEIAECIIINPLTFYWKEGMSLDDQGLAKDLSLFKSYQRSMLKTDKWLKLIRGEVDMKGFIRSAMASINSKLQSKHPSLSHDKTEGIGDQDLSTDLEKIVASDIHISFIIADRDPGYELLMIHAKKQVNRLIKQGQLSIDIIKNASHTFPLSSARQRAITKITGNLLSRY